MRLPGMNWSVEKIASPRERILDAAMSVMFLDGVHKAGVNRVLEASGAYKKSFYKYFDNVEQLQLAYLDRQRRIFLDFLMRLCDRNQSFEAFWRLWTGLLLKQARRKRYPGCQFARYAAQAEMDRRSRLVLREFTDSWTQILAAFLQKTNPNFSAKQATLRALRLMYLFEGAVAVYSLTGDAEHLQRLAELGAGAGSRDW